LPINDQTSLQKPAPGGEAKHDGVDARRFRELHARGGSPIWRVATTPCFSFGARPRVAEPSPGARASYQQEWLPTS